MLFRSERVCAMEDMLSSMVQCIDDLEVRVSVLRGEGARLRCSVDDGEALARFGKSLTLSIGASSPTPPARV